jgi:hypothetical protein
MRSRWSDVEARDAVTRWGAAFGEDLALRAYTSRLLGAEDTLVLHGGGNTSVKGTFTNRLGDSIPAMWVKASGQNLATIEPAGFTGVDLAYLGRLRALDALDDDAMANEMRGHLLDARSGTPSLETLVHAFLPEKFVDHTHADAVLTLTNQAGGERIVREALGNDVIVLPYVRPGFPLARAVAEAYDAQPGSRGMVWMRHGLMTWGGRCARGVRHHDHDRDARGGVHPPPAAARHWIPREDARLEGAGARAGGGAGGARRPRDADRRSRPPAPPRRRRPARHRRGAGLRRRHSRAGAGADPAAHVGPSHPDEGAAAVDRRAVLG